MSFTDILRDAVRNVDGAISASLVGVDGIVVETVQAEDAREMQAVGAGAVNGRTYVGNSALSSASGSDDQGLEVEVASLVTAVSRMTSATGGGDIREIIVDAERQSFLIASIDPNYFLVIIAGSMANLGRARFELRRAAQKISAQF